MFFLSRIRLKVVGLGGLPSQTRRPRAAYGVDTDAGVANVDIGVAVAGGRLAQAMGRGDRPYGAVVPVDTEVVVAITTVRVVLPGPPPVEVLPSPGRETPAHRVPTATRLDVFRVAGRGTLPRVGRLGPVAVPGLAKAGADATVLAPTDEGAVLAGPHAV